MTEDRLVEVRVKGLRSLADVRLKLDGLTVLLGENGAGKSSLLEAFELLRKAADAPNYVQSLAAHGGLSLLLREGAPALELGVRIDGDEGAIDYRFGIANEGGRIVVATESMDLGPLPGHGRPLEVIRRTRASSTAFDQSAKKLAPVPIEPGALLVSAFGILPPQRAIARVVALLRRIDVHLPFDVRAFWVCKERGWSAALRDPSLIEPAAKLSRIGDNLANAYHALKNEQPAQHWRETMDLVRLGLGPDVESVNTQTSPGGGQIALSMELSGLRRQIPAAAMADGTLAYLAFVALARLGAPRSLLAFDEPDLHLHPHLLIRVLGLFETLARSGPVVLATQSDRLLDGLSDPANAAVLCRVSARGAAPGLRATSLVRPNPTALARWLERYRGLGELRGEGAEDLVMTETT